MGQPAAKQGDRVLAVDTHVVMIPSPGGPVPTPLPHPFVGVLDGSLSDDVTIAGMAAATVGSTATNTPAHVPMGGPFQTPPSDRATVRVGSPTVRINGQAAVRNGDAADTCNDPADLAIGTVVAVGAVMIG